MEELKKKVFTTFNNKIKDEDATICLINLFFDLNKKMPNLTMKETYLLRKYYSIFDNGKIQSYEVISNELNCTEANTIYLLSNIRGKIISIMNDAKDNLPAF